MIEVPLLPLDLSLLSSDNESILTIVDCLLDSRKFFKEKVQEMSEENLKTKKELEKTEKRIENLKEETKHLQQQLNRAQINYELLQSNYNGNETKLKEKKIFCDKLQKTIHQRDHHHQVTLQKGEIEIEHLKDKLKKLNNIKINSVKDNLIYCKELQEIPGTNSEIETNVAETFKKIYQREKSENNHLKSILQNILYTLIEILGENNIEVLENIPDLEYLINMPIDEVSLKFLKKHSDSLIETFKRLLSSYNTKNTHIRILNEEKIVLEKEIRRMRIQYKET